MTLLALSLGSNVDAPKNLLDAITALRSKFGVLAISTIYESKAIGFSGDNFLNFVVSVETSYSLKDVFDYLKDLENDMGRNRTKARYSDRTIDIDILLFGDSTGEECGLDLPRAEILYNAFILRPLAELHPQLKHTVLDVSYKNLWNAFDNKNQKLWPTKIKL